MSDWDRMTNRELEEEMASLRSWMARANIDASAHEETSRAAAERARAARLRSLELGNRLAEMDRILYERAKAEVSAVLTREERR